MLSESVPTNHMVCSVSLQSGIRQFYSSLSSASSNSLQVIFCGVEPMELQEEVERMKKESRKTHPNDSYSLSLEDLHAWENNVEHHLKKYHRKFIHLYFCKDLTSKQENLLLQILSCLEKNSLEISFCFSFKTLPESLLQAFDTSSFPFFHVSPLFERQDEIDSLVYRWIQLHIQKKNCFSVTRVSLEAMAHIHIAIVQQKKTSTDLYHFLDTLLFQAEQTPSELYAGEITAWFVLSLLEKEWGYQSRKQKEGTKSIEELFFSTSLEQVAFQSNLPKEAIENHCKVLLQIIDSLPSHLKNYQGLTSKLDQLNWLGMKLISSARTQSEMRDFFGFGNAKGKIPKATTKLKFDQYSLEQYGPGASDPQPWEDYESSRPFLTPTETVVPTKELSVPPASRSLLRMEQEKEDAELFWENQDLFTLLTADNISQKQLSHMAGLPEKELKKRLAPLVEKKFIQCNQNIYSLAQDDVYMHHEKNQMRFFEENLHRYLDFSQEKAGGIHFIENLPLFLPEEGLPKLREQLLNPFLTQEWGTISDMDQDADPLNYDKKMFALILIGTNRQSAFVNRNVSPNEKAFLYFKEAMLQRCNPIQKHNAICLQATQMLTKEGGEKGFQSISDLRKRLKKYQSQGRGKKCNFHLTMCFTEVPIWFFRNGFKC